MKEEEALNPTINTGVSVAVMVMFPLVVGAVVVVIVSLPMVGV